MSLKAKGYPFRELALLGERLGSTSARLEKIRLMADFLRKLAPEEATPAVRLLLGQLFPAWDGRALELSWAALLRALDELIDLDDEGRRAAFAQAVDGGEAVRLLLERGRKEAPKGPPLVIPEVYRVFEAIAETSGPGSRERKEAMLRSLLERATPLEAKYIAKDVLGEMRHGASEGLLMEAIAQAVGVKGEQVRRACFLCGDIGEVAGLALTKGEEGLKQVKLRLGRPLKPMLAQTAESIAEAFRYHGGRIALEYKLDGARVQVHKDGSRVRFFSRHLSEVTESLPDLVERVRGGLRAERAVLEGEVIAVDEAGRPLPFQHLMRRFRRLHDVERMVREIPVRLYLFDCLYRNGESLVDAPYLRRWQALTEVAGAIPLVPRMLPRTVEEGEAFAGEARRQGHEGVMAKHLDSPYTPGIRGKAWFKIKHAISLDLVIVAAEWGYGRRHGWLSNYHLAARDEETGQFWEVGKTFKGLTDAEFQEMTRRLLALKRRERGGVVEVTPQVVVEVQFNEIQASPHYPSGMALRFARISRIREDKSPQEADTIQTMRELYEKQFRHKGRHREARGP